MAWSSTTNNTFLLYTFLCENCLDAQLELGTEATAADAAMGWALSERAVKDAGDPAAVLGLHERDFGPFTARLGSARAPAAQFDAAAATAGRPVNGSGRAVATTPGAFQDGGDDDDNGGGGGDGDNQEDDDDSDDDD